MKNSIILITVVFAFLSSCKKEEEGVVPQPVVVTVKDTLNCNLSTSIIYDTSQTIDLVSVRCNFKNNTGSCYYPPDSIFMNNIFLNSVYSFNGYFDRYFGLINPPFSPINSLDSLAWDCRGSSTLPAFRKKNMYMPYVDYSYLALDSLSISQNTVIQHPTIYAKDIQYRIYYGEGTNTPIYSHGIWHYGSSSGFTIDLNDLNYPMIPLNQFFFVIEMNVYDRKIDYLLDTFKITESTLMSISKKVYPKN